MLWLSLIDCVCNRNWCFYWWEYWAIPYQWDNRSRSWVTTLSSMLTRLLFISVVTLLNDPLVEQHLGTAEENLGSFFPWFHGCSMKLIIVLRAHLIDSMTYALNTTPSQKSTHVEPYHNYQCYKHRKLPRDEPWVSWHSQEDFEFSDVVFKAALTKDQITTLVTVFRKCLWGEGSFALESYSDLKKTWDAAAELLSLVCTM